jgi:O-antigen/teichoic acid export membrane protein
LDKGLLILILGYVLFLSGHDLAILDFAYAQTCALTLTALVAASILYFKKPFRGPRLPPERVRTIVKQAAPFALAVFLMTIYTRIDGVMIEQLAVDGEYQSGAYAAGYRLLDAANMIAYLFAVLLLPMMTKSLGDNDAIRRLLSQGSRVMLAVTVIVVACCVTYRHQVMELLYTQATDEWASIFGLLIASFAAIGGMYVFGTYLTARGDIRQLNILYISCVSLNVVLNLLLIFRLGARGAAIATLLTQSVATAALVIMTIRKAQVSIRGSRILSAVLFLGLCVVISYGSIQVDSLGWVVRFAGTAILMGGAALITRLIKIEELRQFIRG